VLKQVMVQEVAVAPDGSSIVYSRRDIVDGAYRKSLWRTTFKGGRPERITAPGSSASRPRFAPDGASLLYLSDRSGRSQPWVLSLSGGEPHILADVPGDVAAAEWSPDGKTVALLAPSGDQRFVVGSADDPTARRIADYTWRLDGAGYRDEFTSLWTVPASGGRPVRRTQPGYDVPTVFWHPSGKRIGFLADREPGVIIETPGVWSLPARGGSATQEAALEGAVAAASWGPSGTLAFIGNPRAESWSSTTDLFVAEGEDVRQLGGELDAWITCTSYGDLIDVEAFGHELPLWLDGRTIVAPVSQRGGTHLYAFGIDGTTAPLTSGDDVVVTGVATGGGRLAAVASVGGPAEVYAVEDGELRPLTRDGSRWFGPFRRSPERVQIPHPDGHDIDTWTLPGRGARRRGPAVLIVHGGPNASFPPVPWLEMLALSDAGFRVLWCNPRGSTSYGEKFARSLDGVWGDPDSGDLLRVVDWAVEQGLADRRRIGIMGLSYGGYMTNWMIGHHPGVFAAAVSENPVTDLVSEYGGSDIGVMIGTEAVGESDPWDRQREFLRGSPYTEIHRNESPLLLLQAESDMRCPPTQSELPFAILRRLGRPVEMVRYPDESHVMFIIGRPDRRVDRLERIVDWFTRHLTPAGAAGRGGRVSARRSGKVSSAKSTGGRSQ
jgi:dipeptidyl aminopeptidase/acylaminoacyl peptidase